MRNLLESQLGLTDFIFAHVKGQPKVVDVCKTTAAIGIVIGDNGAGMCYIKVRTASCAVVIFLFVY
jgi:hypothetical protein